MNAAQLFKKGQQFLAKQYPATIRIGTHDYQVATAGLQSADPLADGGSEADRRITFWLPLAALAALGQPVPRTEALVTCTTPERLAGQYRVASALVDAAAANVTLRCEEQAQ